MFLETEVWGIREKNTFQDFPIDNKVKKNITIIFDGRSFGLSRLSDRETIYGWNYSKKFCCSYKVNRAATGACGNLWLVRFRWRFYKSEMKVSVFIVPLCSASEHFLNLSCIMLQNGQAYFKRLAAFIASLLKYVWPFWETRVCGTFLTRRIVRNINILLFFFFFFRFAVFLGFFGSWQLIIFEKK